MAWLYLVLIGVLVGQVLSQDGAVCQLDQSDLFPEIPESAEKGDVIIHLSFSGSEDQIELRSGYNEYFALDTSTRNIIVNATLDADIDGLESQNLVVYCKITSSGREIDYQVVIRITDVNDNPPIFTHNVYNISIGEMTSINDRIDMTNYILATDGDLSPVFNFVFYSIVEGPYSNYLVLEGSSAPIFRLSRRLDYESLRNFSFTLMAQDYFPGSNPEVKFNSTCLVVVTVEDEDDQYPIFNSSIYQGLITSTTTVGSPITITPPISAYDPDTTLNARVQYSFHGDVYESSRLQTLSSQEADVGPHLTSDGAGQSGQYFNIDKMTGEVTLVKRPTSNEIYLLLQATQEDNPSRYGVALLTMQVQGTNVNAPVFTKNNYDVLTFEGFPTGKVIATVLALDKDAVSSVSYKLFNSSDVFSVDSLSGDVRLNQQLSYSTNPTYYRVYIEATDGQLTSVASVTVQVLKSKVRHPPVITNINLNVSARRNQNQPVIDINAEDPEGTNSLSYSLLNHQDIFSIDEDNGVIRIIADASDIGHNTYQVTALVTASGQPSLERAVSVLVSFPELETTTTSPSVAQPSTASTDDMLPIVLGAGVAVLLIILIILLVYILRNRYKDKEHLDRVKKQHPSRDPRVLAFKPKSFGKKAGSRLDQIEFREAELDGATTIQENPLSSSSKGSYFNFGQSGTDNEGDLDPYNYNNDIQVETSVVPFNRQRMNDDNNNDNIYNNSQLSVDSEDAAHMEKNALAAFYRNGSLSTYPDSSGSEMSLNTSPTDSNDSKKGLVSSSRDPEDKGIYWVNNGGTSLPPLSSHMELDPDTSVQPSAQKQELTVYF